MESPGHWYSIQMELIIKSIEAIFEVRLKDKHKLRRSHSSTQNIVLQTLISENNKIRDECIDYNFSFPWSLTINFSLGSTIIEQWKFIFSVLDKHPLSDIYKQATISLRSILSISHLLPAYSIFLQGISLNYSYTDIHSSVPKTKTRLILLKSQAGTLFVDIAYTKNPDNIEKVVQVHIPQIHGRTTPPCIEWHPASLSVSSSSSELSPPYSPLGSTLQFSKPKILPNYIINSDEDIKISAKKQRKSYDMSQLARECTKLLINFDNALTDVEGYEEVLKEFYSLKSEQ